MVSKETDVEHGNVIDLSTLKGNSARTFSGVGIHGLVRRLNEEGVYELRGRIKDPMTGIETAVPVRDDAVSADELVELTVSALIPALRIVVAQELSKYFMENPRG